VDRQFEARYDGLASYGSSQFITSEGGVASEGLSIASEGDRFGKCSRSR